MSLTLDNALNSVGPGWADLVRQAWTITQRHGGVLEQAKEKFGTLRWYADWPTDEAYDAAQPLISEIEVLSESLCEQCGAPGRMRNRADYPQQPLSVWLLTLCDQCFDERLAARHPAAFTIAAKDNHDDHT